MPPKIILSSSKEKYSSLSVSAASKSIEYEMRPLLTKRYFAIGMPVIIGVVGVYYQCNEMLGRAKCIYDNSMKQYKLDNHVTGVMQ